MLSAIPTMYDFGRSNDEAVSFKLNTYVFFSFSLTEKKKIMTSNLCFLISFFS